MPITLGDTTITGLGAGGLPSAVVTADTLAASLNLASKTLTLPAGKTVDSPKYESAWVQIVQGGNYFFAHGLGRQPKMIRAWCKWDNAGDNKPWMAIGDLGVWGSATGQDFGMVAGVSNSLICVAIGEGGISSDWASSQNGWPMDNNALENFYNSKGQNNGGDFMDTPTENGGTWGSGWVKVLAW